MSDGWRLVARIYDSAMIPLEGVILRRWREQLRSRLPREGTIIEIGAGTGVNLRMFDGPPRAVLIDLSVDMLLAGRRRRGHRATLVNGDAETLPIRSHSADAVVATLVYCSVSEPAAGFREVRRVLRPGAPFLLIEHVRPRSRLLGPVSDYLTRWTEQLWGEYFNRRTVEGLEASGFDVACHRAAIGGGLVLLEARAR